LLRQVMSRFIGYRSTADRDPGAVRHLRGGRGCRIRYGMDSRQDPLTLAVSLPVRAGANLVFNRLNSFNGRYFPRPQRH
jgi:hypothetical protein